MGETVIGPSSEAFPSMAVATCVQIKAAWSDAWITAPDFEFQSASCSTAGHDLDHCTILHRYGTVKPPWLAEFIERSATSLNGCWVRVLFCGSQGSQNAWIGRIANDTRQIFGGTSGMQAITAYGPQNILRRISVSRSYWMVSEGAVSRRVEIGWLPPVNETHGRTDRDKSSGSHADKRFETSRSGNRSEKHDGNHYLHGGEELWTYRQYCEYLLAMFVDDSAQNGPTWRLDGQIEALDLFTEPIEWGVVVTVDQMLRRLISPALGLDYKIVETGDGFAVRVFSLVSQSCGWGEHTIPANPDTVTVEAGQTVTNVQTQIERSSDHRYGTIRALGGRTVACGSLTPKAATLTRGWRYELEAQYNAGTGVSTDAPYLHDLARHQEKFRDVYRRWIFREQSALFDKIVEFDGNGQPTEKHRNQRRARSTLPWLPLDADADYSQEPPEDLAATSTTWLGASLRRPQVWLCDDASAETLVFTPAAAAGIGVSVLPTALGIFLHTTPNHLVGGYSFYGSTETPAKYNQDDIVATLAWHTDQRMFCEQKTADAGTSDGVLEIDCSDCQLWQLLPTTMLDIDANRQMVVSPDHTILVRNDWARLASRMAGAMARYYQDRARAQITVRGLLPWSALIGQILTVVDDGGDAQTIEATITSIQWTQGDHPTTIISTGFARGV